MAHVKKDTPAAGLVDWRVQPGRVGVDHGAAETVENVRVDITWSEAARAGQSRAAAYKNQK